MKFILNNDLKSVNYAILGLDMKYEGKIIDEKGKKEYKELYDKMIKMYSDDINTLKSALNLLRKLNDTSRARNILASIEGLIEFDTNVLTKYQKERRL